MNKKTIILLALSAIIIFVIGGFAGTIYQSQKDAPAIKQAQAGVALLQKLNSKVISNISAYGNVAGIVGRVVTLNFGKELLEFNLSDSTIIGFYKGDRATVNDINRGQKINMLMKISPEGEFIVKSVVVYPQTQK